MKAEINGVKLEGTPEEIAQFVDAYGKSPAQQNVESKKTSVDMEEFLERFRHSPQIAPEKTWVKPPWTIEGYPYPHGVGDATFPNTTTVWYI